MYDVFPILGIFFGPDESSDEEVDLHTSGYDT